MLVFLPISFTAPLTNAILGDQASAVIFAMILSLFISLTLIPIIALRLHPPREGGTVRSPRGLARWSEAVMLGLISGYRRALSWLLSGSVRAASAIAGSFLILVLVVQFLMPLIPREIISPPASNRVVVFFRSTEISDRVQIVEEIVPELESRVQEAAGDSVTGSFALVSGRFNILFINFTDADAAAASLGELERVFVSDNNFYFNVSMWDPAQLPLPRTNDLQISVHGEDEARVVLLLEEIRDMVNDSELYGRVFTDPPTGLSNQLSMRARSEIIDGFSGVTTSSLTSMVFEDTPGNISSRVRGGTGDRQRLRRLSRTEP